MWNACILALTLGLVDGVAFRRPVAILKRTTTLRLPRAPATGVRLAMAGQYDDQHTDAHDGNSASDSAAEEWAAKLRTPNVQALRANLIEQYIKLGRTQDYAEKEVGEFLADPSRSRTWIRAQELQDMPGWGFGKVPGTRTRAGEPSASQIPLFLAFFVGGALLKFGAERIGDLL